MPATAAPCHIVNAGLGICLINFVATLLAINKNCMQFVVLTFSFWVLIMIDEPEPGLDVTEKDLESDDATRALYENWCKAYDKERSLDEMARRFPIFKRCARDAHRYRARLGHNADGIEIEDETGAIKVIDPWELMGTDDFREQVNIVMQKRWELCKKRELENTRVLQEQRTSHTENT